MNPIRDRRSPCALLLLLSSGLMLHGMGSTALPADEDVSLKKGDRIVFLGDSITQAGAGPGGYVTRVKEVLAKEAAGLEIEVVGAGVSGNRVPDLERRLEKDVLAKQPTVVVIYIGINDVWHSLQKRGTPKDEFEAGLKRIIAKIQEKGARVILCTATVIGEKTDGGNPLDAMLDEYCEVSRKVAGETKSQLLDLRKAFLAQQKLRNVKNADKGVLTSDSVHLNAAGNEFVAAQMLSALGVKPKEAKVLRHMVLFQFKPDVTPAQIKEVEEAFSALPSRIDAIIEFERGTDVSVENKAAGFTHGFLVTFRDEKGRDAYLPHPAHAEFVKLVGPRLQNVLVFDYWTQR